MDPDLSNGFGWRARLGYIAPAVVYDVQGIEFYRLLPDGVMVVMTNLGIDGLEDNSSIDAALQNLENCTSRLDKFNADIVCLAGNPPGANGGLAGEVQILDRMRACTDKPVTTTPNSAVEALRFLGAERIAIGSPLAPIQNEQLAAYFEEVGIKVTNIAGPHVKHNEIRLLGGGASYRAGLQAARGGTRPDAVYLPCMAWPTIENAAPLEQDLGVPAFSSVMSMAWNAMRLLGIDARRPGYGELFTRDARG